MLKIAICDDNYVAVKLTQKLVDETANARKLKIETFLYQNPEELEHALLRKMEVFDILLLDIDMPNISGFELAERIRNARMDTLIIFITSYDSYVFKSLNYYPFRFVRKILSEEEIPEALDAAIDFIDKRDDRYFICKTEDEEIRLYYKDVTFFEKEGRYIVYHTIQGAEYRTRNTLKNIIELFDPSSFVQIHSGCVINLKYLQAFQKTHITLDEGLSLPVSRTRADAVKQQLSLYWGQTL